MRKTLGIPFYLVALTALTAMAWTSVAQAVPSFSRETAKGCSYCHAAWPQLNKKGRAFKELGYRLPGAKGMTFKERIDEAAFPVSAILIARPYDKKDSGDTKLRALHEVELMVAGAIGGKWSGFVELEAEDETGFEVEVAPVVLSYNQSKALNVQMVWGPFMWADPYGFLGDNFRLTRGHAGFIDQKYGGADGKIRDTRQNISLYGRPMDQLFYSVGYAGESKDAEGVRARNVYARLAFDVTPDVMVGGFAINGDADSSGRDYTRYGVDFQADLNSGAGTTRLQGAFVSGTDRNAALTADEDNDAFSLQAFHIFKTETGRPTWVPLIRFDSYEKNNGGDQYEELTLNLTRYIGQNRSEERRVGKECRSRWSPYH